jgi:hypothetical protein
MTPPPPSGEGHPERAPEDGARLRPDSVGPGRPPPAEPGPLFPGEPSDDAPTVITRMPPRPATSDDVFGGTLRGRRLAHFELIEPIGVGGMAAVLRARDLQLERQVALKILPPEMAADEENVRRFHQEARAAAKLDHENIARVFFCGEDQKLHFIAFEFVEGMNLRALIERRGRLPVDEALRYMLQVATGLAHASERGVIHRDIKPSNIIISPHGRAKLVDMGLARQMGPHKDQALTQSGVTLGTFDYISPEQALEPRDADVRSDIYSLGCTFYHALTGQPPVPDGTAARKLHHHQHVAPVDPRQLNPEIPDEMAAILARMMAKDPKDRYQRPEHLVQHIMQVAQKLGALAEVPDGVLFVDAPLPSAPRPRPLLMALLAVLAVGVVIVVYLQTMPRGRPPDDLPRPPVAVVHAAPPQAGHANEQPPVRDDRPRKGSDLRPVVRAQTSVYDADRPRPQDIAEFIARHQGESRLMVGLADDLDMTGAGLVFDGGKGSILTLGPKDPKHRPTIRFKFPAESPPPARDTDQPAVTAALTVKSGTVRVHDLCIVIDAAAAPDVVMAALWLQGGRIEVDNCVFVQERPSDNPEQPGRLSALEVEGAAGPEPRSEPAATFSRCCFLGGPGPQSAAQPFAGQNAITLKGRRGVRLTDCAFGPHAAAVALLGGEESPGASSDVQLQHCSALLAGTSAVFRLESALPRTLTANNCLFSQPGDGAEESAPRAVLIRQGEGSSPPTWKGTNNRFHNLDAFCLGPKDEVVATSLSDFREAVPGQLDRGEVLAQGTSPWEQTDPLSFLDYKRPDVLRQAFQVNTQLADLRPRDNPDRHLIGVEQLAWSDPAYTRGLSPLKERRPERTASAHEKVVNPDDRTRQTGEYSSLADALDKAAPNDVILLHCNGPYLTRPIPLTRANLDVTIRPDRDCHPVLTLDPDTDEEEAALFRLRDGKLHLEGLEFALKPANARFKAQSVVAALGEGECDFKDCVVTLEQSGDTRLAVLTLADLPGVMKTDRGDRPATGRATFKFQNCFVRGTGDAIAARAGRPFDLDADNLLVALCGSFLNREAADDAPAAPADAADTVRLAHVTAYLTCYLVRFRAKDTRALMPAQFKVADCLFVAAGDKALVHLDGAEASDERLAALLGWSGQHNAYTDFPEMLDQQPDSGAMPAMPYTRDRWKAFTREADPAFDRVKLDNRPATDAPLAALTPARFRVKPDDMRSPDMQPYGVDLEQLPKVAAPADAAMAPED